ncbi:zinc finger protein 189-like isoform X2 [Toxorhynchites rutilus septentrionalis]|uniref:zinc finger protein 189-like isoform X2 n=1 Tax=Toxorhynchites rutilus septentrionalis TaxID=329112 RepID=UPI002479B76B|nr:zinc finger protein 189-like isoform X2 [Toxorhynchites rutilus septentrionalis]
MKQMCRLCLQDGPDLGILGDDTASGNEDDTNAADCLVQLILRYLSIRIVKHESTANAMICCSCRMSVEEWHTFRESCMRNDEVYQRVISRSITSSATFDKTTLTDEDSRAVILKNEPSYIDAKPAENDDADFEQMHYKDEQLSNSCCDDNYEIDKSDDKQMDNDDDDDCPDFEEIEFDEVSDSSSDDEYVVKSTVFSTRNKVNKINTTLEIIPLKKRGGSRIQTKNTKDTDIPGLNQEAPTLDKSQEIVAKKVSSRIRISPVKVSKKRGRPKEAIRNAKRAEVCTICGKCIKNMTEHMRIHNNEKRHQCPYCSKAFQYAMLNSLKQHRITHFKERIYVCPVCGKAYYQPTGLARHKRTHYEEPKIKCSACDKMFMTNADLRKHFTKHLDEKPFSCEICSRAFSRKDNLRTHMKTHRGITPTSRKASANTKSSKTTGNNTPETTAITE